ncbi:hypothetical protein ACUUL3_08360 [Thiovibrio sp. JS02]
MLVFLLLASGCATLPATRPLAGPEQERAATLFLETVARQEACGCCLDVQVQLVLRSVLQNGSLTGYLQAMSPSFLKFVGINPLGQPLLVMATDGRFFRSVVVPAAKGYEGEVGSSLFKKYAPEGFDPAQGFYWLTGRLPGKGLRVFSVARDAESGGQWLEAGYPGEEMRHHLLFDPVEQVIRRHLLVDDGRIVMAVRYSHYLRWGDAENGCVLPGFIAVEDSGKSGATMEITMSDWLRAPGFVEEDFSVSLPPGFERVIIK